MQVIFAERLDWISFLNLLIQEAYLIKYPIHTFQYLNRSLSRQQFARKRKLPSIVWKTQESSMNSNQDGPACHRNSNCSFHPIKAHDNALCAETKRYRQPGKALLCSKRHTCCRVRQEWAWVEPAHEAR